MSRFPIFDRNLSIFEGAILLFAENGTSEAYLATTTRQVANDTLLFSASKTWSRQRLSNARSAQLDSSIAKEEQIKKV